MQEQLAGPSGWYRHVSGSRHDDPTGVHTEAPLSGASARLVLVPTGAPAGDAARGLNMSSTVKDLIDAGIHFGQRRSNWNPKMGPYIYGVRNKIHIIDLRTTIRGLLQAKKFVRQVVLDGKDVVFVGTKRQARAAIEKYAVDVGMPWVIERWLGGTLTNFRTIRERLNRLEELEGLEQSGEIETYSKKMASQLHREKR